jgi:sulfopyruvate decarboxylase subunit alpha
MTIPDGGTWQADLGSALASAGVEVAAWVQDKRLAPVSAILTAEGVPLRTLTREEECVAYAAGFRAAGRMPLVLMQCSGLGNAMNAFGSLVVPYGLGFPMVVSMRGTLGERNPTQVSMGRAAIDMLALLGIGSFSLRRRDEIDAIVRGAVDMARDARQVAPIILEPELDL